MGGFVIYDWLGTEVGYGFKTREEAEQEVKDNLDPEETYHIIELRY